MKIHGTSGITALILASIAASCTAPARNSLQSGGVYLVGVAGGN